MKQLNNGFLQYYYITEDGTVINTKFNRELKCGRNHLVTLITVEGNRKQVTIKTLYRLAFNREFCIDKIEDLPNETWKEISGTNNKYFISDMGRLKSFCNYESRIIKPDTNNRGYNSVCLSLDYGIEKRYIHRLVAAAFIPNDDKSKNTVDHINGDKNDNRIENLRWLTQSDNVKEYYAALNAGGKL